MAEENKAEATAPLEKSGRIAVCGETFCELCGDCVYCYGEDPCYRNPGTGTPFGSHVWPQKIMAVDRGYDARKAEE